MDPAGPNRTSFSPWPYVLYLLLLTLFAIILSSLEPSAAGYGTHRQLGFPACGFLTVTGYPCPSCGVTTALALSISGEWLIALVTQPFGLFLAIVLGSLGFIAILALGRKIPLSELLNSKGSELLQVILLILFFLSWFYKIYIMKLVS